MKKRLIYFILTMAGLFIKRIEIMSLDCFKVKLEYIRDKNNEFDREFLSLCHNLFSCNNSDTNFYLPSRDKILGVISEYEKDIKELRDKKQIKKQLKDLKNLKKCLIFGEQNGFEDEYCLWG